MRGLGRARRPGARTRARTDVPGIGAAGSSSWYAYACGSAVGWLAGTCVPCVRPVRLAPWHEFVRRHVQVQPHRQRERNEREQRRVGIMCGGHPAGLCVHAGGWVAPPHPAVLSAREGGHCLAAGYQPGELVLLRRILLLPSLYLFIPRTLILVLRGRNHYFNLVRNSSAQYDLS